VAGCVLFNIHTNLTFRLSTQKGPVASSDGRQDTGRKDGRTDGRTVRPGGTAAADWPRLARTIYQLNARRGVKLDEVVTLRGWKLRNEYRKAAKTCVSEKCDYFRGEVGKAWRNYLYHILSRLAAQHSVRPAGRSGRFV
jgi:hypothetical protein